ncbi:Oidioi.mRNA.OKI2018_I69.chr2.g3964.t1.cds [Oikopleura dioica]|uniref:Oidioi.mRNA.OKI2018_I69.chr2.g3964.t1.cds n=1 Tax=Oikopleura dioica TaxID=34765 RepID=A0ABN7SZP5_OIKDI|nr:Oidioi.mRNA.OKI2018_I69.chr2.g3964.t1.cds [Oikopleura dioica]
MFLFALFSLAVQVQGKENSPKASYNGYDVFVESRDQCSEKKEFFCNESDSSRICGEWNCPNGISEFSSCTAFARSFSESETKEYQRTCYCHTNVGPFNVFTGCKWKTEEIESTTPKPKTTKSTTQNTTRSKSNKKDCVISPGKATVTCSSEGVSILIDKCVVPDVAKAAIHLNDENCLAVDGDDDKWEIIKAPASIPDTSFVVKTCTVEDEALTDTSLALVEDKCPLENGLNFVWGEKTTSDLKFSFTIFIFPQSADSAKMTISCNIDFCKADDPNCLADCSASDEDSGPRNSILVLRNSVLDAYVISREGNSKVSAKITAPVGNYPKDAQHALIGNKLYIFGGISDKRKIAVLENCAFGEKSAKLLNDIDNGSAALSIDGNSRVLICFANGENKNHCEIYDGSSSTSATSSNYGHAFGKLGMYKNQPTTVGSSYDTEKGETLTNNEWRVIGDPPISGRFWGHVLVGLESGNLLMLGGWTDGNVILDHVWLLSNDSWSRTGTLKSAMYVHSSLKINDSIFLIPGYGEPNHSLERIDMEGDEIKSSEIIGTHSNSQVVPVLFPVSAGFCA